MHNQMQPLVLQKIALDAVDDLVAFNRVPPCGHLHMHAGELPPRPVIVDHQIVHAQNARIAHQLLADTADQLRRRRVAQQRVERLLNQRNAADEDEHGHRRADIAVQIQPGQPRDHRAQQHRAGGNHVVSAVAGRRFQRGRADAPPHVRIERRHPAFDHDGRGQHADAHPAEHNRLGRKDLADAAAEQLHADGDNHHRDGHAGEVFKPPVAVGMLRVGGSVGELEAQQADQTAGCIRQVVHRVGHDRDRAAEQTGNQLARKEQHVAADAHQARRLAVGAAHALVFHIFMVRNPGNNPFRQRVSHAPS